MPWTYVSKRQRSKADTVPLLILGAARSVSNIGLNLLIFANMASIPLELGLPKSP